MFRSHEIRDRAFESFYEGPNRGDRASIQTLFHIVPLIPTNFRGTERYHLSDRCRLIRPCIHWGDTFRDCFQSTLSSAAVPPPSLLLGSIPAVCEPASCRQAGIPPRYSQAARAVGLAQFLWAASRHGRSVPPTPRC